MQQGEEVKETRPILLSSDRKENQPERKKTTKSPL
jgi:hypothetical protein